MFVLGKPFLPSLIFAGKERRGMLVRCLFALALALHANLFLGWGVHLSLFCIVVRVEKKKSFITFIIGAVV